jgi:hypothetical protein
VVEVISPVVVQSAARNAYRMRRTALRRRQYELRLPDRELPHR